MEFTHRLTLFRRHTTECTKGYSKAFRILETDSKKSTGKPQCECTIVAQGTLPSGRFLPHKSTGEIVWDEAKKIAQLWWTWGDTTPPADVVKEIQQQEQSDKATSIPEAIEIFMAWKKSQNVGEEIQTHFRQLLDGRFVPFCKNRSEYIQQMDNAQAWSDFRQSWVNLNPLHNRKPEDGVMPKLKPVEPGTARRLLGEVRHFIRFCIRRHWLSENWASREYLKVIVHVEPKEPFSDEDVENIYEGTKYITYNPSYAPWRVRV